MPTSVPFMDLRPAHERLHAEVLAAVGEIAATGGFILGPAVAEFEEAFAGYCGTAACAGVASGIDALRLILIAARIGPGDEVVVPAMTFIATAEAVTQAGATPVLADVSPGDYGLDPAGADTVRTTRTRALLPVHLYGQLADLRALGTLGVPIVEDACQAHGATRDGLRAGTVGFASAFSFYPTKNLGAWGDAGAAVSDDVELAERIRALRHHGQTAPNHHELPGYTARLDTLQAVVLLHKLPFVDEWTEQRRAAARFYTHELDGVGDLTLPPVAPGSEPVWHLYVVRSPRREELARHLGDRGIGTARHYPTPVHLTPAYAGLGHARGAFPVAEALADEGLSLPMFAGITEEQQHAVVDAIRAFFRG
jgi:dTDP-4-amino-4,6-dideoxygalactose transaminase